MIREDDQNGRKNSLILPLNVFEGTLSKLDASEFIIRYLGYGVDIVNKRVNNNTVSNLFPTIVNPIRKHDVLIINTTQ